MLSIFYLGSSTRLGLPNENTLFKKNGLFLVNLNASKIEKIRFEDKFEFVEEVDESCKNVFVLNMILQPLFENAIKHAVYKPWKK